MIKIRILNENIVTEQQEQMSLDEVIDFYDNNINSFVAMANGEQQKDPQLWKKFERIASDCYNTLQKGYDEIKKWSNNQDPRAVSYVERLGSFFKKFTSFLKGEEVKDSELVSVPIMQKSSFIIPKNGDGLSDEELKKVFYVLESYTKWYENLKGKLGSWSQRNLPTMRKMIGLREAFITEQEKITLSQIVGDNSVVSFDFDNTLVKSFVDFDEDGELIYVNGGSNATMINLMKHLIDDPSKKVYVVTSRSQGADEKNPEQGVPAQLERLNLKPNGLFYTNTQPKVTKLKDLGVEIHFDDDKKEHDDIQGSGIQSFYPDDFLEDTNQVSKVIAVTLDNKVLILKRADTGEFDIPGGHGKSGETAEFTAIRETMEETGLNVYGIKQIKAKEVEFQGRKEDITYFYAKLNNTSDMLKDDIDLDTEENTEFYFVEPQFIDDFMSNATNNLKNVANEIKSLTIDEHTEPFQRKMAAKHRKYMNQMFKSGGFKKKMGPYNQNPPMTRSKSAPPGFGAIGEAKKQQKKVIKVKISQNLDEKRKKKRKKRKKRKKTAKYGGYYPYFDLYDGSGGDAGGDGGGGE